MSATALERQLFEQALELDSAEERSSFLRQACGGNELMLVRLEALVAAHLAKDDFLPPSPRSRYESSAESPGRMIDRYKLLEPIGEGGFGIVYLAEQTGELRRRVALKVIKPGMDSRQVIRRFEAERQTLARMDHPHIARVFDAGTTESGRPYFVMERVDGISITKFCQEHALSLEERLRLFIEVCAGVQHAHQKGIIHRDLKPSNVLVTLHDGRPVPKIIDFGIAKALHEPLTERTAPSQFQPLLGTPAYMSPEQAALGGQDVDTRSDIYSLGVLLYELITGSPPFDQEELLRSGFDEMRKTICEREPERPSTRATRATGPQALVPRLTASIPRELDFIVLKALEKKRERRYATANGLAADLERHLHHEPVTAVAPTLTYQLAKLYQRNRKVVSTALAFASLLLVAAVVSSTLAFRAHRAETLAVREAATSRNVSDFLWRELLKRLTPWTHTNADVSLREAFELAAGRIDYRLSSEPLAEAAVRLAFGRTYLGLFEFPAAESNLVRAVTLYRTHAGSLPSEPAADALFQLATLREFQSRTADAESLFWEAAEIRSRILGETHRDTVSATAKAVLAQSQRLPAAEAVPLLNVHLERMSRYVGESHFAAIAILRRLGELERDAGHYREAYDVFERTQSLVAAEEGEFSAGALTGLELMAQVRALQGDFSGAESQLREVIAHRTRNTSADNTLTLGSQMKLVQHVLLPQHRYAEAAALLLELANITRDSRPEFHDAFTASLEALQEEWQARGGGSELEDFQRRAADHLPAHATQ